MSRRRQGPAAGERGPVFPASPWVPAAPGRGEGAGRGFGQFPGTRGKKSLGQLSLPVHVPTGDRSHFSKPVRFPTKALFGVAQETHSGLEIRE